ncbi:MAG: sensor domain-containing protein [Neptuniibacter sp.]
MIGNDGNKPLQLLFTLLSVILLSALAFFAFSIWQDVKNIELKKLYQQNKTLIENTQTFFHQKTRLVVKTVQPTLSTQAEDETYSQISDIFDYLLSTTDESVAYALLDTDGNTLLIRGDLNTSTPNYNPNVLAKVVGSKTAQIGYQYRSGIFSQSYLPLYIPILDNKKQPIAIVAVFFYAQGKNSIMSSFVSGGNTIWLLGDQGRVRLTYPLPTGIVSNLFGSKLSEDTSNQIQEQLQLGKSHQGIKINIAKEELLANVSYLAEYQLISINSQPASTIYLIWLNRMQPVGIVFMLFLFAALLGYRFSIKISKKITDARLKAESNVKKLSKAIEQSPNSVVITDNNWCIEYANKNFELSSNKPSSRDEAPGHNIIDYPPYNLIADDLEQITEQIELSGNWFSERKADFESKWYSFSISHITTQEQAITHYVTVVQDITERKHAEAELYKQANFDPLTGLPNRRKANENLTSQIQEAWKHKKQVAVLYIDIDNFKAVNDTYGHQIGDQLLSLMAKRLLKCCKDIAQICHIGGDEFLVYYTHTEPKDIERLALNLLNNVSTPVIVEGKEIFISISIGVSKYPDDSNDVTGLIKYADMALYESKKTGRNRHSYFDLELDKKLKRKSAIESELRQALSKQEISMAYQSKNDIKTKRIIGFEALMRWGNVSLGRIGPEEFIQIAEETGLINELGEYALRQACFDLVEFQKHTNTPLRMAVNLSVKQLNDDKILDILDAVLKETFLDPSRLELEITESLLAENLDLLLPRLEKLIERGVTLSIDDFGTGYSSLSYLTSFPVNTLKVDRAFVKDMAFNKGDATLTNTIIAMAHGLGLKVVAEGIEDETQLKMLNQFGCDIGQGYLFSKPISKNEMLLLVETEKLPEISKAKIT